MIRYGMYDWADIQENVAQTSDEQNALETEERKQKLEYVDRNFVRNANYFVNFEDLEEHHKVLVRDICLTPGYDYESTPLKEYVERTLLFHNARLNETENALLQEGLPIETGKSAPVETDYHLFDFNDDGVEDYLLCIYGAFGHDGFYNSVSIFVQEESGIRSIMNIDINLYHELSDHARFTVLDEKTNGYYAIVPPDGNFILRYDADQEKYDFGVGQ